MSSNGLDVLVIGEGLAGITAAAAARSHGLQVMLVSTGPGTFALGNACIDLDKLSAGNLGFCDFGPKEMEAAISFFLDLASKAECDYAGSLGERRLVPTILGTFQEVSLAPQSLWEGDPRGFASAVIAGFERMPSFDADFVAERLSFHSRKLGLNTSYRSVIASLPSNHKHALTPVEVADRIDRDPDYRGAVVATLKAVVGDAERLIIPGILGINSHDYDLCRFENEIGCAICELPTLPPSVPCLRMLRWFERHLARLGVELCTGFSVQKLRLEGGRCTGVLLDTPGRPRAVDADSVILASGRFSRLIDDVAANAVESCVDEHLHPVDCEGKVVASNLFACGSILRKFEPRYDNAIAILSGYQAAALACASGVHYAGR
jgi:glycerol-3-phosphate dehydrogenase subunit B